MGSISYGAKRWLFLSPHYFPTRELLDRDWDNLANDNPITAETLDHVHNTGRPKELNHAS